MKSLKKNATGCCSQGQHLDNDGNCCNQIDNAETVVTMEHYVVLKVVNIVVVILVRMSVKMVNVN